MAWLDSGEGGCTNSNSCDIENSSGWIRNLKIYDYVPSTGGGGGGNTGSNERFYDYGFFYT